MPLYEYKCTSCGKLCEVLQKINDAPEVTCPACGKDNLKRQVSASRFQLKGQGWYETDFKTKKPAKAEADTESKQSPPTESSSTTTEVKSETPTKKEDNS